MAKTGRSVRFATDKRFTLIHWVGSPDLGIVGRYPGRPYRGPDRYTFPNTAVAPQRFARLHILLYCRGRAHTPTNSSVFTALGHPAQALGLGRSGHLHAKIVVALALALHAASDVAALAPSTRGLRDRCKLRLGVEEQPTDLAARLAVDHCPWCNQLCWVIETDSR